MIRQANRQDIEELSLLRVEHQKTEGKEDYHCDDTELQNKAKEYFSKHLNKDYFCLIKEINNRIIATCAVQVLVWFHQYVVALKNCF